MHDNNKSQSIEYNLLDLTSCCLPSNVGKKRDGTPYIKRWDVTKQFMDKGILTLHKMAEMGLMNDVKFKPYSTFINQKENYAKVSILREKSNKELPPYQYEEKKEITMY